MTIVKRFLNLKVFAIVALLLFVVACYFAARKVMASDIVRGMDKATVIEMLGQPIWVLPPLGDNSEVLFWQRELISQNIFHQDTMVLFDEAGKVWCIRNVPFLFNYGFGSGDELNANNIMKLLQQMKQEAK